VSVLPSLSSCKTPKAAGVQSPLAAQAVDPEYRKDWERVLDAQARDPSSVDVVEAADTLLAREPPLELRVAALHAKAQQSFLSGADVLALQTIDGALPLLKEGGDAVSQGLRDETLRLRVRAAVRGGDPALAVRLATDASAEGLFSERDLSGAKAVAFDRASEHEAALVAFAEWRARVSADDAEAGYAERRINALAGGIPTARLVELAESTSVTAAAACLEARAGLRSASGQPDWVAACRDLPKRIGILLPRTGPLAALADGHLGAAVAAVTVLSQTRAAEVVWRDSGSTPQTAGAAAQALVMDGAQVIVGPVGHAGVTAAANSAGSVPIVAPGEASEASFGVAPSLEARLVALVRTLAPAASRGVVLFAPSNSYGDRAASAAQTALKGQGVKLLKIQRYDPTTTSFRETVSPVLSQLSRTDAAVIVVDSAGRTELLVRQLRRAGVAVSSERGKGTMVGTTAEGLGPKNLGQGHAALEGILVAPVAAAADDDAAFIEAFEQAQGTRPDPQALLVWHALRRAWVGETAAAPESAQVVAIRGGRLVPLASSE
jgi:ABC-type branched-subunit amino acid transport system substrate-binding protein